MKRPQRSTPAVLAIVLGLLLGATGCGGSDQAGTTTTTKPKAEGKVEVNLDDEDNPTVEYTDDEGTTTEFGATLPEGWPAALEPPASITVVSSSTAKADAGKDLYVSGESELSFEQVNAGIKQQLSDGGFEVSSDLTSDDGTFAGVEAHDDEVTATITVASDPVTKKVTVLYKVSPA